MRIGIIGSGITGLASAWLLEGAGHEVTLFEKNDYLGGHAHTLNVQWGGHTTSVDTAFSYLSKQMYPTFLVLLRRLGVRVEPSPASFTLYSSATRKTILLNPTRHMGRLYTALQPDMLFKIGQFAHAIEAASIYEKQDDWSVSVGEFLDRLPRLGEFPNKIMLPMLIGLMGASCEDTKAFSIRAAAKFFVCPRVKGTPWKSDFLKIANGAVSYVNALAEQLHWVDKRLNAEILTIQKQMGRFVVTERNQKTNEFDRLIVASPPHKTREMLSAMPGTERIRQLLDRMKYIETKIVVHSDSSFMPPMRRHWSLSNKVLNEDGGCEKTLWCGWANGVDVYRSWMTFSSITPRDTHGTYSYLHPLMTPEYFRAQSALAQVGELEGLWLAGSYLRDIDTHESGLRSAMDAVRQIYPESRNLHWLESLSKES